jgi:AmmeMemoRadiSam system protein B
MELTTRKPAVAGMFYPAGKRALKKSIRSYLQGVPDQEFQGELKALIVPHAGYVYSGQVAAYAFAQLKKWHDTRKSKEPTRIILLGPAHTLFVQGVVTDENALWDTPLGRISAHFDGFPQNALAHTHEHCLEVEVPFLQEVLSDFHILPLLAGKVDPEKEATRIIPLLDDNTILLISTDLSHFYDYQTATSLDTRTIEAIQQLDYESFEEVGDACGKYPVLILLEIAQKLKWECRLLKYCNSGDISDQFESVVGYAAFDFFKTH